MPSTVAADNSDHLVDRRSGLYLAVDGDRLFREAWMDSKLAVYQSPASPRS